MPDLNDAPRWLYRGVPAESPEVADVNATGEIEPPRPERTGQRWREFHQAGDTETAYTSWTSDRSIAVEAALSMADTHSLSGRQIVFRVLFSSVPEDQIFDGRADEDEYLIEGVVESVEISETGSDDEEEDEV